MRRFIYKGIVYESNQPLSSHAQATLNGLKELGYSDSITSRGTILAYHGTSKANINSIMKSMTFKGHPWFALDEATAKRYAQTKGPNYIVMPVLLDPDAVSITGGYLTARAEGLTQKGWSSSNSIWHLKDAKENLDESDLTHQTPEHRKPRAPASDKFRTWRGYSNIPVVYHATPMDFREFDVTKSDLGAHFGTYEQAAKRIKNRNDDGGKVLAFFLNIRNPLRLKDEGSFHATAIAGQLLRKGIISKEEFKDISINGSYRSGNEPKYDAMVRQKIIASGYDGVVYKNTMEGSGDSYIVFDPKNIKSATDNNGEFNLDAGDFTQE